MTRVRNRSSSIFVDESIHERGDFIVTAAVSASANIQDEVYSALSSVGLRPGVDEYKSGLRMTGEIARQRLRGKLENLLRDCKIAVTVCPISERPIIARFVGDLLLALDPTPVEPANVFFDDGIARDGAAFPKNYSPKFNCDSRTTAGIQVADCAAHTISTVLLGELGLVRKMIRVDNYPVPNGEAQLAWALWASVRHALAGSTPLTSYDEEGFCEPLMRPHGLVVSENCSDEVKEAARARLSQVWLGCIEDDSGTLDACAVEIG